MRLSLYLYGHFNGSLVVAIEEDETAATPLVWERRGPWTDDWEDVTLQLTGLQHGSVEGKRSRCSYKVLLQSVDCLED